MLVKSTKVITKGCDYGWGMELAPLGRMGKASLGSLKAEELESWKCLGRRAAWVQTLGQARTDVFQEHWHLGPKAGVAHLCFRTFWLPPADLHHIGAGPGDGLWSTQPNAPASGPGGEFTTILSLFTTCQGVLGRHRLFLKTTFYGAVYKAIQPDRIFFL